MGSAIVLVETIKYPSWSSVTSNGAGSCDKHARGTHDPASLRCPDDPLNVAEGIA